MDFIRDFLYYNTIGVTVGLFSFLGLEYISDKDNFKTNLVGYGEKVKYWILDKVVTGFMIYKDIFNLKEKHSETDRLEYDRLEYDENGEICSSNNAIKSFIKTIINEKEYFVNSKIISENLRVSNPFMNIAIIFGDKTINIKDKLEKFLVVENCFDKLFFKAFMLEFYGEKLDEKYNISILDHDCNVELINETERINIMGNDYEVID